MSEGRNKHFVIQIRLATLLVAVAAVSAGLSAVKSERLLLAIWGAFPFTVGIIAGALAPNRMAAILAAIIASPLLVPALWIVTFQAFGLGQNFPDASDGKALSAYILAPGIFMYGTIPAGLGALIGRYLNRKARPKES